MRRPATANGRPGCKVIITNTKNKPGSDGEQGETAFAAAMRAAIARKAVRT
jgi:hypothetical protein